VPFHPIFNDRRAHRAKSASRSPSVRRRFTLGCFGEIQSVQFANGRHQEGTRRGVHDFSLSPDRLHGRSRRGLGPVGYVVSRIEQHASAHGSSRPGCSSGAGSRFSTAWTNEVKPVAALQAGCQGQPADQLVTFAWATLSIIGHPGVSPGFFTKDGHIGTRAWERGRQTRAGILPHCEIIGAGPSPPST